MATSREDRKKALLAEGVRLREMLATQVQTAVCGPNAVTKGVRFIKKIKAIGIKPFAIGGGALGLLLLKPWRFFIKKKQPLPEITPKGESLTTRLVRYAKTLMPIARVAMSLGGQPGKTSNPSSQLLSFLLEKISSLLPKKSR